MLEQVEGLTGVHCCGNTDWSLLLRSQVDIINFDACEYLENLALYPRELNAFLERGGRLAWGLVPNNERIFSADLAGLRAQLKLGLALLGERGSTGGDAPPGHAGNPSCGLDGADEETAAAVYKMTGEFVEELNKGMVVNERRTAPASLVPAARPVGRGTCGKWRSCLNVTSLTPFARAPAPQPHGVFRPGYRHLHDHGRPLHPRLRLCGVEKGEPPAPGRGEPQRVAEVAGASSSSTWWSPRSPGTTWTTEGGSLRGDHPGRTQGIAGGERGGAGAGFPGKRGESGHGGARRVPTSSTTTWRRCRRLLPEGAPASGVPAFPAPVAPGKELNSGLVSKSGLMVGLGEKREELEAAFSTWPGRDATSSPSASTCAPRASCLEVERFWEPREFAELEDIARGCGLREVVSAPWCAARTGAKREHAENNLLRSSKEKEVEMLIIAEKINVMMKAIGTAIKDRDKKPIQEMALLQAEGSQLAGYKPGPRHKEGPEKMRFVVEAVQEVSSCPGPGHHEYRSHEGRPGRW